MKQILRFNTIPNVCHFTRNDTNTTMTTRKEEKRRHKKSKNVTLWERKKSSDNNANTLRFIEDEDRTTTLSDWGRSSPVSSVGGSVQNTNNENEDALEVLANSCLLYTSPSPRD